VTPSAEIVVNSAIQACAVIVVHLAIQVLERRRTSSSLPQFLVKGGLDAALGALRQLELLFADLTESRLARKDADETTATGACADSEERSHDGPPGAGTANGRYRSGRCGSGALWFSTEAGQHRATNRPPCWHASASYLPHPRLVRQSSRKPLSTSSQH
jgi:hypothetical protein